MYVYVKFEASPAVIKVISNVTIDEDCCPVVDGKLIHETPSVGESSALSPGNVDAISWFKSLPMEAVYIDCTTRDARWCVRPVKIWDSNVQRRGSGRTLPQDSVSVLLLLLFSRKACCFNVYCLFLLEDGSRTVRCTELVIESALHE